MFYFGTSFSIQQLTTLEEEYRCPSCGFTAPVWILGLGEGTGHSPYMLDDEGAVRQAREEAKSSAELDAANLRDFLGCASCPSCRKIDRRSLIRFWLRGALLVAAAVGVFTLIGIGLPMLDPGPVEAARWIATLGGIVAALFIAQSQLFQWLGIRNRITFVAPYEAPPAPRKKRKKKRKPVQSTEDGELE
jgi:hypothetical protein